MVDEIADWLQSFPDAKYMNKLAQMQDTDTVLTIDTRDLSQPILNRLRTEFDQIIKAMEQAVRVIITTVLSRTHLLPIHCRLIHAEAFRVPTISAIGERHLDNPILIRGRVMSVSPKRPYFFSFEYHCNGCNKDFTLNVGDVGDIIRKPKKCSACESRKIDIRHTERADYQRIKIIEVKPSQIPTSLQLLVFDDLCNKAIPGTVIECFGKLGVDWNARDPINTVLVNNLEGLVMDDEIFALTPEDMKRFARWLPDGTENPEWIGNEPQFMEKFRDSFARGIVVGYEDIRHAIILQIASLASEDNKSVGVNNVIETLKELIDTQTINTYLVGSSGTVKSTLIRYAIKASPMGDYTSVANSTEAGLTVSGGKDQETGYMMMEPGFLPRCHKGLAGLDEFDKAKRFVYDALHEAGSHKTISSSKGGQVVRLPADCAWLGGGNTSFGQWKKTETLAENLSYMPVTMLSRFDLIFILHDTPNEARDEAIAMAVLDKGDDEFWLKYLDDTEDYYGLVTIRKYLTYLYLYTPFPKIPRDMRQRLAKRYAKKRTDPKMHDVINARYVPSMAKLAVAQSRFMQEKEVTEAEIDTAMSILDKSLNEAAFDPATGELDSNILEKLDTKHKIGKKLSEKAMVMHAFKKIRKATNDDHATTEDLQAVLKEDFGMPEDVSKSVIEAQKDKLIYESHKAGVRGWRLLVD